MRGGQRQELLLALSRARLWRGFDETEVARYGGLFGRISWERKRTRDGSEFQQQRFEPFLPEEDAGPR